jgi:general secretion pathway protein K
MRRDGGYAMIAAIVGIAAFSLIAFEILAANRGAVSSVAAQYENAKLSAAADAGLAQAIHNLDMQDRTQRWPIDGRPTTMRFGDIVLTIIVEDERGKVPLNRLNEDQVRSMFAATGMSGGRLDTLVDSFEDWQDDDDEMRTNGAEAPYYAPQGIKPRNGDFVTIDELSLIKGMDAALFAKLAPSLTVFFGDNGGFSQSTAQPMALAVMLGTGADTPAVIERERELAGERPAIDIADDINIIGRPLTIRVAARDSMHGYLQRATIVEFTGDKKNPFWIRYLD